MLRRLTQVSLSTWIFIGLGLGMVVGLFFGELCRPLNFIGKAFLRLLQMAVLPYMLVSLIHGVGSLSPTDAKLMAGKGLTMLVLFWLAGLAVIFAFSLAFPVVESSSFFSVSEPRLHEPHEILEQYIPANIFDALSDSLIPAVVLFSVFLGVALLRVRNNEPFLNIMSILAQALTQMTKMIIKTAPIGVFALTAVAAGTLSVDELQRLQVYFICYILAAFVLTFWLLPMLVTCFTEFTFKDVLSFSKDALALGFATGNNFVVLAVIADKSKELFAKVAPREEKTGNMIDSVLPLTYSFPNVGKLIEILFILFVAWYTNYALGIAKHLELALAGVTSLFGSPKVAVPFLLNYMGLPSDFFDLYIMADVVTRRFKVLVQTMSMQALTLTVTYLLIRKAVFSRRKILGSVAVTVCLMALFFLTARVGLDHLVRNIYHEDKILMGMEIKELTPATVQTSSPNIHDNLLPLTEKQEDLLKRIKKRGALRVGYDADALPFAFFNSKSQLVGHDIYFAHLLARDLGVSIELIPVQKGRMPEYFDAGICDIVMSAVPMRVGDLGKINFTRTYMEMKAAFIVRDYRKKEFQTRATMAAMSEFRIAVTPANSPEDRRLLSGYLPNAKFVELNSIRDFFSKPDVADALLTTDKIGKAWALLYPEFGVVVPKPHLFVYDVAYTIPITQGDYIFLEYLNNWLTLQKTSGVTAQQFDYWVLGKTPERHRPRWAVIRDVLHWVD